MKNLRLGLVSLFAASGIALMGASANAAVGDSVTGSFTSDHCTGGCLTGQTSGGTVTVTELGGGALQFSVTLLNGNQFINGGFDASFGFNLGTGTGGTTHPAITYSAITPAANFTIPGGNPQSADGLHMDGTGFFLYGLDAVGNGGSQPDGSSLSFIVTGTGLTLSSLETNSFGQFFAADIISGTTGKTGGIDVSSLSGCPTCNFQQVPEPGSLAILGTAFAMFGILARRRRWI